MYTTIFEILAFCRFTCVCSPDAHVYSKMPNRIALPNRKQFYDVFWRI